MKSGQRGECSTLPGRGIPSGELYEHSCIRSLSSRLMYRPVEHGVRTLWFFCAISSIVDIFCILGFLLWDAIPSFLERGLIPFLTGERWDMASVIPKYGTKKDTGSSGGSYDHAGHITRERRT